MSTAAIDQQTQEAWSFAQKIQELGNQIRPFDFNNGYQELQTYKVKLSESPGLEEILSKLSVVQTHKDRVVEMMIVANNVLGMTERAYEQIFEVNLIGRQEKSREQREIAAKSICIPQYTLYQKAKEYSESVKLILNNLQSVTMTLSRQITILQLTADLDPSKKSQSSFGRMLNEADRLEKMNSLRANNEE